MAGGVREPRAIQNKFRMAPEPPPTQAFSPQAKAAKAARLWLSVPRPEGAKAWGCAGG